MEEALESEGGWTKGALDKFYKLDSALREIGRFYGLMQCLLLNAVSALVISSDDHRFYQLYYPASLWLVVNWRMGSMFLLDIVSLLTGRPSISILKSTLIHIDAICSGLTNCAAMILLIQSIPFLLLMQP